MTASSTFRELSLEPGSIPDGKPSGLNVTSQRSGGPIQLRYRVEFLDADGAVVTGGTEETPDHGSVTLQWWAIMFQSPELQVASAAYPWPLLPQSTVRAAELGDPETLDDGEPRLLALRGPFWAWPQVTAITAPVVYGKIIQVSLPELTPDGTYSITRDDEDPVEVEATSDSAAVILAALEAGFAADTVVDLEVDDDARTITFRSAAGIDFELELSSPGDIMEQDDVPLGSTAGVTTSARIIAHVVGPLVE